MGQLSDKGPLRKVLGLSYDADRRPLDVLDCGHTKVMAIEITRGRSAYVARKHRRCPECGARLAAMLATSAR